MSNLRSIIGNASMGPRLCGRGDRTGSHRLLMFAPRFNGAAPLWARRLFEHFI